MNTTKSALAVGAKLGLAGLVICAVAWSVVVFQPDGTVSESEADILDLNFIHLSNSARFARGLKHLGHDSPQTFDINGNVVNFSTNFSRKSPEQLFKEYQDEFVHQGLNKKSWPLRDPSQDTEAQDAERIFAAMTGGVVPLISNENMIAMGGVLPTNDATDEEGMKELASSTNLEDRKIFKGHHYIEMFWDKETHKSTVLASWSDENFDYRKMRDAYMAADAPPTPGVPTSGNSVDTEVPACPGCSRINRVRDLDATRTYSSNVFVGERPQAELMDFYRNAMVRRGWQETEASENLNLALPYVEHKGSASTMLSFSQGERFLTILGYPGDDGRTQIHTSITK